MLCLNSGGKPQLFAPEEGKTAHTHTQSQLGNRKEEKERKGESKKRKKQIMNKLGERKSLS